MIVTHADGQEGDSLVNSSEGRDIDGLATDGTLGSDTGAVFPRAGVNDSVNENLYNGYFRSYLWF